MFSGLLAMCGLKRPRITHSGSSDRLTIKPVSASPSPSLPDMLTDPALADLPLVVYVEPLPIVSIEVARAD